MTDYKQQHTSSRGRGAGRAGVKNRKGSSRKLISGALPTASSLSRFSISSMPLFPAKTQKTLRYQEYVTLTTTSGTLNSYVFSANGLYDPNITGTGHQPMGFDQLMVFYEHYTIRRTRISVNFIYTGTGTASAGLRVDAAATALGNIQQMLEFGGITYDNFEAKNTYGCTKTLSESVDMCKYQGVSPSALTAETALRGDVASNPSEQTYFHLVAWDPNSLTGSFTCDVVIEFDAIFTEPRVATQSLKRVEQPKDSLKETSSCCVKKCTH